jgi:hypothetical protein
MPTSHLLAGDGWETNFKFDKFQQIDNLIPPANAMHAGSGAPGFLYWQQQVDYSIQVQLDEVKHHITGTETVKYHNKSPHNLKYLWVSLDHNLYRPTSKSHLSATTTADEFKAVSIEHFERLLARDRIDCGVNITAVTTQAGQPLKYTIVDTMMAVDLPEILKPNSDVTFKIDWNYGVANTKLMPGRTGYEYFEEDKNTIYEIAHWYPRLATYTEQKGWQLKNYLGTGEFDLEFGDFDVSITVPDDHIVAATGVLQNPNEVLTQAQRDRLEKAKTATEPVYIVTADEALQNESHKPVGTKTWKFKAGKVRDFAFACSRKYIWDAQQTNVEGNPVMAMSLYPKEGNPLWSKYSTKAVIHALNVYSRFTFPYPYPVAWSINGPVGGMEHPMVAFTSMRPEKDGTYSEIQKYAMISVVIHEVGHNYFPMIVNNDEREWAWMDEGLNSFVEFQAETEWEKGYLFRKRNPKDVATFMMNGPQVPIMTQSDSVINLGQVAYTKPLAALNVLRETVLGRERFDYAFKEYARRWMFKRPTPADFFRTMEDASGTDLDWFWRGWFYTTDYNDTAIESVTLFHKKSGDPEIDKPWVKEQRVKEPKTILEIRNDPAPKLIDSHPELKDFYNQFDKDAVTLQEKKEFEKYVKSLTESEKKILEADMYFYLLKIKNNGGLVMPVIVELQYDDNTKKEVRYPAEIWRYSPQEIYKVVISPKPIKRFLLDPHLETADANLNNNSYPPQIIEADFEVKKEKKDEKNNMQKAKEAEDMSKKEVEGEGKK